MNDYVKKAINDAVYDDKRTLYSSFFSSGTQTSGKMNNKLELISLICLVSQKMSIDNKTVTTKDVIEKIVGHVLNYNDSYDHYLIGLSIVCDDMMVGVTEIDSFGLKTSTEIINKIKNILAEWLPF